MTTNHKRDIADNIKNKILHLKTESLKFGGTPTSFGGAMYKSYHASRVCDYLTEEEIKDKLSALLSEINALEEMLSNIE